MMEPFTCSHCGALRATDARFCKKCGKPFVAQRVRPRSLATSPQVTKPVAHAPQPATTSTPTAARRDAWQKPVVFAVWTVVTAALFLGLLLQPPPIDDGVDEGPAAPTATPTPEPTATPALPPKPPDVDEVYRCEVRGPGGEVLGEFNIMLLSKRYVWEVGSTTLVRGIGDITRKAQPFSPELLGLLSSAREVIVIGTADATPVSVPDNPQENRRADDRASTLFDVVTRVRGGREQSVFKANFGQWRDAAGGVSYDDQRRIIIVEVRQRTAGLPMNVGLRQALEQNRSRQRIFQHLLDNYSRSGDFEVL